ncbi:MAG: YfhO family protein, partial [Acidobacteriota bacterium]
FFVAWFGRSQRSLVGFWTGVAVAAIVLAFGDFLPFGLNRILYHLPVYNLFRASARHLFEFDFSIGVIAGLGVSHLARSDRAAAIRAFRPAAIILTLLVAGTAIAYRFLGDYLVTSLPRPAGAESLRTPEGLYPLVFLVLTVGSVWLYARSRSAWMGALLVAVLFADLGAFGHLFYWRVTRMSINKRLADPETVKFVKEREADLNSFRIVSYSSAPFYEADDGLNFPNVSIARGLQSINGYDALRLLRPSEVAGQMTLDGQIEDPSVFDVEHQGLNLLNAKYLFYQPSGPLDGLRGVTLEGIQFEDKFLNWNLTSGTHLEFTPAPVTASSLALVTTMSNATHVPDDTPVARIRLQTADGRTLEHEILTGRDTSEWAYDRDPRQMLHRRAPIAETWNGGGFPAHRYLLKFEFPRAQIVRMELDYLRQDASILILRASYGDSQTGSTMPVDTFTPTAARWRKLATFGRADVYENLKLLPRAWFVRRLEVSPRADVIKAIRSGRFRDGSVFDPAEVALLEIEDFGGRQIKLPAIGDTAGSTVKVARFEPQRIVLETNHTQAGFLVLSEVYYRGWEAWVDGGRVPVERVDYALRGLVLPPGQHHVEMVFRAHTFRTGAVYSGVGAIALLVGALITRRRRRR